MFALLLAAAPAVPNDIGGRYVAGAYIVFVLLLLIYVAIMGTKLARIERGLGEVAEIAEARREGEAPAAAPQATTPTATVTPGGAATGGAAAGTTTRESRP